MSKKRINLIMDAHPLKNAHPLNKGTPFEIKK